MIHTKIQWAHSTVNPIMGCGGCELFITPGKILRMLDEALAFTGNWPPGTSRTIYRELIKKTFALIETPLTGHSDTVSTTNLWHLRYHFVAVVRAEHGRDAAKIADLAIARGLTCYAAKLHLNKARSILNPTRGANSGYAPTFETVTRFFGRVWEMARTPDLRDHPDLEKLWLDGCRRLVFVSDMGDAFSRDSDFGFLEKEVIAPIRSPEGQRHFWLWLTKRPDRMARFGERIGGFPKNVCAMTTVTGPDKLSRIDQLRVVPATVRGLSVEPLWNRIPHEDLDLSGLSWLVAGGESGRKDAVRPFHLEWARELRDLCQVENVAFFLKQLGRLPIEDGRALKLKDSHGGVWDEWPEDLRVREMPITFM